MSQSKKPKPGKGKQQSPKTQAEGDFKSRVISKPLRENGPVFPLGRQGEVGLLRDFSVRPWKTPEERALGALEDKNPDSNMGKWVSIVLSYMCPTWGGMKFDDIEMVERQVHISTMTMADVMTAYCWLRHESLGPHIDMELTSPYTGKRFDWVGDIGSIEVRSVEKLEDALWDYELQVPMKIRGKKIKKLVMGPQHWNHIEMMDKVVGAAKVEVIGSSVHSIPDIQEGPMVLIPGDLDDMTKRDIEAISGKINDNSLGPRMVLEVVDATHEEEPGKIFWVPLDWRYDRFFSNSSL